MMKNKKFDCVKMKEEIQDKINKEFAGVPDKEKYEIIRKRINNNKLLNK